MAGAVPSVNKAPGPTSDAAAAISAAIALIVVLVLVVARRIRPARPPGASREADQDGRRDGLAGFLRAAKHRMQRAVPADGGVEAELGLSATRRPPSRLQALRSARQPKPSCPICAGDLASGSGLQQLPCGHLCHRSCAARWLNGFEVTCPLWRVFSFLSRA